MSKRIHLFRHADCERSLCWQKCLKLTKKKLIFFPFVHKKFNVFSSLITASKRQRASASYDDTPSCQVHGAQSHPTAGEQQPRHISLSCPSPISLFVLIGTHVFINTFLHLRIYLLNKNSCSLEGGSKNCLDHICLHPRFNIVPMTNRMHSLTASERYCKE